jgi:hypothetical protein
VDASAADAAKRREGTNPGSEHDANT